MRPAALCHVVEGQQPCWQPTTSHCNQQASVSEHETAQKGLQGTSANSLGWLRPETKTQPGLLPPLSTPFLSAQPRRAVTMPSPALWGQQQAPSSSLLPAIGRASPIAIAWDKACTHLWLLTMAITTTSCASLAVHLYLSPILMLDQQQGPYLI